MPGHRFYVPPEKISGDKVVVDGDEAHHMRRVLRLGIGDEVNLFDGDGREVRARIESAAGQTVTLQVLEELGGEIESPLAFTLAQCLIKGEKFDIVIQKAVELGVTSLLPLASEHTDVKLNEARAGKKLERWQRIALEATKQCGRRRVMEVLAPISWSEFVATASAPVLLFAERGGHSLNEIVKQWQAVSAITAVVGQEGGWSENELSEAARAGFYLLTMGPRILRAETAGITVAALIQHLFGDMN